MQIILYQIREPEHYMIKGLSGESITLTGSLRDDSDILRPVITVQPPRNIYNANYAHIPDFGRYYYIRSMRLLRTNLWELTMEVDALMTWSKSIGEIVAYRISTSSAEVKHGLPDGAARISAIRDIQPLIIPATPDKTQFGDQSIVMIVAGNSTAPITTQEVDNNDGEADAAKSV